MKSFIIIFISFFLFASCSKPDIWQVRQPNSTPVLEMSEEFTGLWNVTGQVLDFRLYDNGLAEFDVLEMDKKHPGLGKKTEDLKTLKQFYLGETETKEIINLLTGDNFLNLKNSYRPEQTCIDNFIENTIHFQYENKEKIIKISGHCDENLASPRQQSFPEFPPVLIVLYKRINAIKSR